MIERNREIKGIKKLSNHVERIHARARTHAYLYMHDVYKII